MAEIVCYMHTFHLTWPTSLHYLVIFLRCCNGTFTKICFYIADPQRQKTYDKKKQRKQNGLQRERTAERCTCQWTPPREHIRAHTGWLTWHSIQNCHKTTAICFGSLIIQTRGQSNLTKSASRGAHSPVRGHPRGSKVVPLNSWGRVSY